MGKNRSARKLRAALPPVFKVYSRDLFAEFARISGTKRGHVCFVMTDRRRKPLTPFTASACEISGLNDDAPTLLQMPVRQKKKKKKKKDFRVSNFALLFFNAVHVDTNPFTLPVRKKKPPKTTTKKRRKKA